MEGDAIDVGKVADEDPEGLGLFRRPQTDRFVVTGAGEVVALRRKLDLPNRIHVAFEANDARPRVEAPQSNRTVFGTGQQHGTIRTERQRVDRTGMAEQRLGRLAGIFVQHPMQYVVGVVIDFFQDFRGL